MTGKKRSGCDNGGDDDVWLYVDDSGTITEYTFTIDVHEKNERETTKQRLIAEEVDCAGNLDRNYGEGEEKVVKVMEEEEEPDNNCDSNIDDMLHPLLLQPTQSDIIVDNLPYLFYKIAGNDGLLNAFELQKVMAMIFAKDLQATEEFGLEACRSMISYADKTRLGNVNYSQFKALWLDIIKWKSMFQQHDVDRNQTIDFQELCQVISKLNVDLQQDTISTIMKRFENKLGFINIDDFIQICCKIQSATQAYSKLDENVTVESFMLDILYS